MCAPVIGAVISGVASIAGSISSANANNAAAMADYKYQVARRDADWKQTLSVWGHKKNDYYNQIDANYDAVGRSYAAEQTRLNETFMQVAFQKQDMLSQLIQGSRVGEVSGRSAAKLNQVALAAYGRNNATLAENLSSARNSMIQRNEDYRRQLMSANNRAWSEVALRPTETFAPKPPTLQGVDPTSALLGMAGGIIGGIGGGKQAPDAYPGAQAQANNWGSSNTSNFNTDVKIPGVNYDAFAKQWGNSFNFGSKAYQT